MSADVMAPNAVNSMPASSARLDLGCGHDHGHDVEFDALNTPDHSPSLEIAVTHAGKTFTLHLPPSATVDDIALLCEAELVQSGGQDGSSNNESGDSTAGYTVTKLIAPPPVGLIQVDRAGKTTVEELFSKLATKQPTANTATTTLKLRLMASPTKAVEALRHTSAIVKQRQARVQELRRKAAAQPRVTRHRHSRAADNNGGFTFNDVRPLAHLPNPDRSLAYLHRLRDDVGIRHIMRLHQYRVGLLTEMDPLQYTSDTHEGTTRVLGLNRNQGQVIELRLRTDAGDGYRDYKTVRLTLCHELAHNVHGPHDAQFWALYRQLVREATAADYIGNGGRVLLDGGREDQYAPAHGDPADEDLGHVDSGGWTGGTFVLGSGEAGAGGRAVGSSASSGTPASQREQRARAAEERLRRMGGGSESTGEDSPSASQ